MDDDEFSVPRPTPAVLKETAEWNIRDADRTIAAWSEGIKHMEERLNAERQRLVRLRNRRAEWARLLRP